MTRVLAIFGLALAVVACSAKAAFTPSAAEIPQFAESFTLADQAGARFELRAFADAPAIVLLSVAPNDPVSEASARSLASLKTGYAENGAIFALLDSSAGDTAGAWPAGLPLLKDRQQLVGETLGVTRGGEAYVIDPKRWTIVYHGPIASDAGVTPTTRPVLTPVKDALDTLLAGKPVVYASYEATGAAIAFPERDRKAEFAAISYADKIAPVLLAKCSACHATGGVAPFAMTGYDAVKAHAPMIRQALRTQEMPPLHTKRTDGPFATVQPLTDAEIKDLVHWIEGGAPRGLGEDSLARDIRPAAPDGSAKTSAN